MSIVPHGERANETRSHRHVSHSPAKGSARHAGKSCMRTRPLKWGPRVLASARFALGLCDHWRFSCVGIPMQRPGPYPGQRCATSPGAISSSRVDRRRGGGARALAPSHRARISSFVHAAHDRRTATRPRFPFHRQHSHLRPSPPALPPPLFECAAWGATTQSSSFKQHT